MNERILRHFSAFWGKMSGTSPLRWYLAHLFSDFGCGFLCNIQCSESYDTKLYAWVYSVPSIYGCYLRSSYYPILDLLVIKVCVGYGIAHEGNLSTARQQSDMSSARQRSDMSSARQRSDMAIARQQNNTRQ